MKKKSSLFSLISFIFIFNIFCFSISAQNSNSLTLEKICSSISEKPNITGDFTQTKTILTNGRSLKSSGKFIICTLGIMWKTQKPFPSSLILTEDKIIQVAANGNKSVMNGEDNQIFSNISNTLSSLFSGNIGELKNNFTYDFSTNINEENLWDWTLSLFPKDFTIASVMENLTLSGTYSQQESQTVLNSLLLTEISGNQTLYEFSNQTYPKEISENEKEIFK